jgi:hypothetical protein
MHACLNMSAVGGLGIYACVAVLQALLDLQRQVWLLGGFDDGRVSSTNQSAVEWQDH